MNLLRIIFLSLVFTAHARAEVANPNLLPFGEEEAFLGNAGIAHDASTGATYYNPAALGFIRNKKISVYGNAYQADHTFIRTEGRINGYDIPLDSSTFNPVPLSSVTIFGNEHFTYAFSVHVPYTSSYEFQMPLQADNTNISLIGNSSVSSLWVGPSFGVRVKPEFAWGISLYGVRYSESAVIMENVNVSTGTAAVQGTSGVSKQLKAWSALTIIGAQWQISPDWRLGARVQTASVDVRGRASYFAVGSGILNGKSFNNLANENGIYARHRIPFQIGMGAKTTKLQDVELLFDLNTQFPIDYQTSPSRPVISERVLTHFVVRGNLGAKWRLNTNQSLLMGMLYNPSSVPTGRSTLTGFSNENFKGATLGLQYDTGVLVTGFGGYFLWANGEYNVENTNDISPVSHQIYGAIMTASYKL